MLQIEFMVTASRLETIVPDMRTRHAIIRDVFIDLVEKGEKIGDFRADLDSASLVTLIYAVIDGHSYQQATLGIPFNLETLEAQLTELTIAWVEA